MRLVEEWMEEEGRERVEAVEERERGEERNMQEEEMMKAEVEKEVGGDGWSPAVVMQRRGALLLSVFHSAHKRSGRAPEARTYI